MCMIKHFQSTQSNKFAISLQYLWKKVGDRVHFLHAEEHKSYYKLALSFLMEVVRHVQGTQNRKLVIFLQDNKMSQLLLCSVVMQNILIFYGGPVMFVVTCFLSFCHHIVFYPVYCSPLKLLQIIKSNFLHFLCCWLVWLSSSFVLILLFMISISYRVFCLHF